MHRFKWFNFIILLVLVTSCGKDLPELNGVDRTEWIADSHACNQKRRRMIEALHHEKDKLLALSEMDIVELLGKPDENELYKRNQKFYYYHLKPSRQFCNEVSDTVMQKLVIRFNAMGLAKEVAIE